MTAGHDLDTVLVGHGRLPWAAVVSLLGNDVCVWADHDGWHRGTCPEHAPPYTHLWACSPVRLVRVRIDENHAFVAELGFHPVPPHGQGHGAGRPVTTQALIPVLDPLAEQLHLDDLVMVRTGTSAPIGFAAWGDAARAWGTSQKDGR